MELDKRIIDGKKPLTCLDIEQAREFEGKLCLFSSSFANYKNICEYARHQQYTGTLSVKDKDKFKYIADEESPYRNENDGYFYELVLPLEWIKEPEKKYRPYTLAEWVDQHEIGEVIHYRDKDYKQEFCVMYSGYIIDDGEDVQDVRTIGRIVLMFTGYFLEELFKDYEICINGEWQPFGVLDE